MNKVVTPEVMDIFNRVIQNEIELQEHLDKRPDLALGLARIKLKTNQQFIHGDFSQQCENEMATTGTSLAGGTHEKSAR